MWLILFFLLGLIIGSFLNCVIYRLGKESFLKGRSYCPNCGHELRWYDLIPLISFIILRGKCRYCGEKISWQYPLIELATGLLFVLVGYLSFVNFAFASPYFQLLFTVYCLLFTCCLVLIFVYDLKHFIIPNSLIVSLLIIMGLWHIAGFLFNYYQGTELLLRLGSGLGAALPFLALVLIFKGKLMGMGDVKLILVMGLLLGWPDTVVALFSAFMIGGIMGVALIVFKKKNLKSKIPFGPLLVIGTIIAWGWGQQILNCYLNFIYYE